MGLSDAEKRMNAVRRLHQKARINPETDCFEWTGYLNPKGYPEMFDGFKMVRTHRFAYQQYRGEIPAGMEIDHICRNRSCVNVRHLRLVTHQENIDCAVWNRGKSHCRYGHEYTPENTYHDPKGLRTRACKQCRKAASDRYSARLKWA